MQIRYDFGEKLDITKFTKQAKHYIAQMPNLEYHFVLPHYKMLSQIDAVDNSTAHLVNIRIFEIKRDKDGEIISQNIIRPYSDTRFKEIKIIQELYKNIYDDKVYWTSNSVAYTVDKIISLLKIIHKINNLQVFI